MSIKYHHGKDNSEMTEDFVFFWGGCFSQWAYSPFTIDGQLFENAEKWMMYNKAIYFDDTEIANLIRELEDPQQIKALGRKVRNFDEYSWSKVAYDIVVKGNIAKFSQNREMKRYLMATNDREIVEASPYDRIWGIGLGTNDPRRFDKSKWDGQNLLGKAIMDVREHFRKEEKENLTW